MTHTPGPWAYSKTSGRILGKVRRHPQSAELGVEMESVPVVAYVRGHHGQQEADDNGMILAAAPELLEALEAILTKADQLQGDISAFTKGVRRDKLSHRASGIQLIASHAIAKARGN